MKAVIPVAGKGTRLLPHTSARQKALLPVAGRPVLDHVLEPLLEAGIDEIVLILGHLGKQIEKHMEGYTDLYYSIVYQYRQLGLGHAVLQALADSDEPVVIALADTIFDVDYEDIIGSSGNLLAVVEVDNPTQFGIVETAGRRVVDLVEKPEEPPSNMAIAGIYRLENERRLKKALEGLMERDETTRGEYQLTDALKWMLENGATFRTETINGWYDCGTPETMLETNRYLLQKSGGSFIHPEAATGNSTIRNSSVMEGCVVQGSVLDNCIVLPGAALEKCSVRDEIVRAGAKLNGYVSHR